MLLFLEYKILHYLQASILITQLIHTYLSWTTVPLTAEVAQVSMTVDTKH